MNVVGGVNKPWNSVCCMQILEQNFQRKVQAKVAVAFCQHVRLLSVGGQLSAACYFKLIILLGNHSLNHD